MKRIQWPLNVVFPGDEAEDVKLPEDVAHYVRDVLRLSVGTIVELFDGKGAAAWASLTKVGLDEVRAHWQRVVVESDKESPLELTLYQAIPKGDRWETILEKVTELGVTKVVPVMSKRGVVQIKQAKLEAKLTRWQKIVSSAARQSGRLRVPEVVEAKSFAQALALAKEEAGVLHLVAALPAKEPAPLEEVEKRLAVWIGPEGGWTPGEIEAVQGLGGQMFSLGPRVLRVDTAAIAVVTMFQHRWGDM